MGSPNLEILKTFDSDHLPNLDVVVLGALELFKEETLPEIKLERYARPLVVGSGNAEATGKIIFKDQDAVFASESTYEEKLKHIKDIDGVVLVSASGGKHAPIIAKCSKEYGKHITLITNTDDSKTDSLLDHEYTYDKYVFPKNREPYTYNTSTYMGMILGFTREDPQAIYDFIQETVAAMDFPDFSKHDKFYLIVPPQFFGIIRMLHVKFIELFGRRVARDVETSEYVKHATTVVPSDEFFISFGEENSKWGDPDKRLTVPLPDTGDYGAMMAISYYTIAQIQKQHPPYFKENIVRYTETISKIFGEEINPIVE